MTIWLGILFYCVNGACEFSQTRTYFQSKTECQAVVSEAIQSAAGNKVTAKGTCADVQIKPEDLHERYDEA